MRLPRNRRTLIAIAVLVIGGPAAWLLARDTEGVEKSVIARVRKGEFKVVVTTSGELRARKFVQITVPPNANQADAYQMKIASIVPEGTLVKAGDIVAELDRSSLAAKTAEVSLALQKAEAVYEQAMLDSTLNLSKAREDMRTMELGLEEKRLAKEQAVYEAPTVRRQAEIDLEKATRALAQAKIDYKTRTEQAMAKMREVGADTERQRNKLRVVQEVMANFTIRAPEPGMVIYQKEWNGKKRTTGSQVSSWDPTVATLPDLTQMESITYVNEIDVRKIVVGQPAVISLDSDPAKKLTGKVTQVANVGEQRPNSDAKVFEVRIEVQQADTTLRPGMTTGNGIETHKTASALFIPLEAVNSEDGIPFVYKKSGGRVSKQEIVTGAMNDDEVVIVTGLELADEVLLSPPENHASLTLARLPGSPNAPKGVGGDTAIGGRPIPAATPPAASPATPPTKKP
ncbi:MAG: HlyD family efflux transporter periplasmic adaptor subunit [Gemmatimonadales bacterium]|nr:HlyD family efflux transporter periplasmic adaptor subunit [Gemmatimonadales bacterium]